MLDLKKIRETPDAVKEGLVARGADPAATAYTVFSAYKEYFL